MTVRPGGQEVSPPCLEPCVAPFDTRLRTRVLFGPGRVAELGEVCRELSGRRVVLVTDRTIRHHGHADRAAAAIRAAGLSVTIFEDVEENPTESNVARCAEVFQRAQPDLVVAIGGGSVLDCAKGANFIHTNGGRMADYRGYGKARTPLLPMVLVPTTAGTGSEAQSYALISHDETHEKMACGDPSAAARVAVLDPELTCTCPATVTAAAGLDAIAHAVESYVCTRANPLSRLYAAGAFRLMALAFPRVLDEPHDVALRGAMLLGANWAGTAIEHAMLGAAHAAANPLTAQFGTVHGVAVALMMPHVVRYNGSVVADRYGELLSIAGFDVSQDPAEQLACLLESWRETAGLPTRLRTLGVPRASLPQLAREAAAQWTAQFNPRPADEAAFRALYTEAY